MPIPLFMPAAQDVWKRYGGDQAAVASYTAPTGSTANLTPAAVTPAAAPSPAQPAPSPVAAPPTGGVAGTNHALKTGTGVGASPVADLSGDARKTWIDNNKPTDPGAYKGPDPYSMHWGGSLVGGSHTGIQDYGNWQNQQAQYQKALQNWQANYDQWQKYYAPSGIDYGDANLGQQPQQQQQSPQPQYVQQNPSQTPINPYAVGRTPDKTTGPVQKPDQSANRVNPAWAGVI